MATELIFLLDRSGSMQGLRDRTISDVNEMINKYKEVPNAYMTLIQFDDKYEPNYSHTRIENVANLSAETYQPRGSTALYDALCKTIDDMGNNLKKLPRDERENLNVVVAVFTDGYENASKEFKSNHVKERIDHQQNKYNWEFVFMGADEKAVLSAGQLGFKHDNTVRMSSSQEGRKFTMANFADKLGAYGIAGAQGATGPSGAVFNYTQEERVAASK